MQLVYAMKEIDWLPCLQLYFKCHIFTLYSAIVQIPLMRSILEASNITKIIEPMETMGMLRFDYESVSILLPIGHRIGTKPFRNIYWSHILSYYLLLTPHHIQINVLSPFVNNIRHQWGLFDKPCLVSLTMVFVLNIHYGIIKDRAVIIRYGL